MFELFYEVAEYANENWRGKMSPREVAVNAYVYTIEMEYSLKHEEMSRGCVLEFDHDAPDRGVTIMIPVDRSCDEWSTDSFWAPRDRKEGGS